MQTIHPHNPRLMLAFGAALLCALVLLLALVHGGSLNLGTAGSHASVSQVATRSTSVATSSALRPDWWKHPLALPFHQVRSSWPATAGPLVGG